MEDLVRCLDDLSLVAKEHVVTKDAQQKIRPGIREAWKAEGSPRAAAALCGGRLGKEPSCSPCDVDRSLDPLSCHRICGPRKRPSAGALLPAMFHQCSRRRGCRIAADQSSFASSEDDGVPRRDAWDRCEPAASPRKAAPTKKPGLANYAESGLSWSGTPGSNRRPSPWQDPDEDLQGDAATCNPAESLAPPCPSGPSDLSADAAECTQLPDPALTRSERSLPPTIAAIPDDRLLTVSDVSLLLQVRKQVVYRACDRGELDYVKFEGTVLVEGRDLKAWFLRQPSGPSRSA